MSEEIQNSKDLLQQAFLAPSSEEIIVKAEDLPQEGGGVDFALSFFEPQVNKTYSIKFLKNLELPTSLVHRKVYKSLPDPKRKGKTFQYVSSGSASTCKVLELFFELHSLKKAGDALATMKIDEFLGVTNQAAALIQVLNSPDKEDIGKFRILTFSTYGPNASVANLLNQKLNPTKDMIENGFEKEDVFNPFESSVMLLSVKEADYDGVKGRDFSGSSWAPKKRGCFVFLDEEKTKIHEFTAADIVNGDFATPEIKIAFDKLVEELRNPHLSIHNFFSYKLPGDKLNTEDTDKYLNLVQEKVDEIVPIIRNAKSLDEIKNYGVATSASEGSGDSAQMIGDAKAADILATSTPTELDNSVMAGQSEQSTAESNPTETNSQTQNDVAAILSGN